MRILLVQHISRTSKKRQQSLQKPFSHFSTKKRHRHPLRLLTARQLQAPFVTNSFPSHTRMPHFLHAFTSFYDVFHFSIKHVFDVHFTCRYHMFALCFPHAYCAFTLRFTCRYLAAYRQFTCVHYLFKLVVIRS